MGQKAAAGTAPREWLRSSEGVKGNGGGGGAGGEWRKEEVPVNLWKSSFRNCRDVLKEAQCSEFPLRTGWQQRPRLARCLQPLVVRAGKSLGSRLSGTHRLAVAHPLESCSQRQKVVSLSSGGLWKCETDSTGSEVQPQLRELCTGWGPSQDRVGGAERSSSPHSS